jgi:3-oxoacyl-[acyl-carrier-protein] synthase-3
MAYWAQIAEMQSYFPNHTLTNEDLSRMFPEHSEEQVFRLSGIRSRYLSNEHETPLDLGAAAADRLFACHPDLRDEVDFLIYCACILDYVAPASACLLHERLGLKRNAGAIDVPMGCSGFTNGLALAKAMVESGQAKCILLITAETPTAVIHPNDFYLRVLFSDAACCTIVRRSSEKKIGAFCFGTDGSGASNLIIHGSGSRDPIDQRWLDTYADVGGMLRGRMEMKGDQILHFALREVPPAVEEILRRNDAKLDDVDWFVFHHASGIILKFLARKMNIPFSKVYSVIESVGNTVSPSIPIALSIGLEKGDIKPGQTVLLCGFGIGYSWSGTLVQI